MSEPGKQFVGPTGYVDLDNDCAYSIDLKSTRSREYIDPKEDLAFYFNTYITPKYGLENLNVSNVASFMKDLEMNWSKLTPSLKDKVLSIIVDGIFPNNYDFKNSFLSKLAPETIQEQPVINEPVYSKSSFGNMGDNSTMIIVGVIVVVLLILYFFVI
jgi:hypothetical protein